MNPLKPYLYGGALLLILGIFGYVKWLSDSRETYKASAAFEQSEKVKAIQTIANIQESANKDRKLLEGYQNVKSEIQYVDREVVKQVIKYRENVVNRCTLSSDWVRIHNDSTDSVRSENSPGGTDDSTTDLAKTTH